MNIIENMPSADYHAHPAVSNSLLSQVAKSPLHARAYLDGVRQKQTAAMSFGSLFHTLVLEPHLFHAQYATFSGDRRTKEGKALYAEIEASGKTVISVEDNVTAAFMANAINNHPAASALLKREGFSKGLAEASVFWTDDEFGVQCKCRPDLWRDDGIVVDLKTTDDASLDGFSRSIATYRYHVQAAHYMAGTGAKRFVFVAVEKKAPYAVAVYELDAVALEVGRMLRQSDLMTYAECLRSNTWPGYSTDVTPISIPAWAYPKDELEEVEVNYV